MSNRKRFLAGIIGFLIPLGLFAAPVGARNDGRRPLRLSETTEILGTSLAPGSYDLRWTREPKSETVRLEITRGKSVLASGKGEWASAEAAYPHEALVYRGAGELAEIRFRNSAEWIRVNGSTGAGTAAAGGAATTNGGK